MQRDTDESRTHTGEFTGSGPVVVGIGETPLSTQLAALQLAAVEANHRRAEVWLVHGCEPLVTATAPAPTKSMQHRRSEGEQLVRGAARMLRRQLDPGRTLHLRVSDGTGAAALVELSRSASLVVLQRRAVSKVQRWHTGSTTSRVRTQAHAPVAVVRAGHRPRVGDGVVVGVDARRHAESALQVAFAEAALRQQSITAVHAWHPVGPSVVHGNVPTEPAELTLMREQARAELGCAIAGHSPTYPDVVVRRRVVQGPLPRCS